MIENKSKYHISVAEQGNDKWLSLDLEQVGRCISKMHLFGFSFFLEVNYLKPLCKFLIAPPLYLYQALDLIFKNQGLSFRNALLDKGNRYLTTSNQAG